VGRVKNLLFTQELKEAADRFSDMYSIEVCEDFHIHWRNLRLQFSLNEWAEFRAALDHAWHCWQNMGGPLPHPDRSLPCYLKVNPGKTLHLNPVHDISGKNFRIEDDDLNGPAIHVHYRSNRLELSHEEFLEMADGFTEAAKKLRASYEQDTTD
jgi:hypothetical protein